MIMFDINNDVKKLSLEEIEKQLVSLDNYEEDCAWSGWSVPEKVNAYRIALQNVLAERVFV